MAKFFKPLRDIAEAVNRLDGPELISEVLTDNFKVREFILDLNRKGQLFDKGINSEGEKLKELVREYAPSTVAKKKRQGLPSDRIILFDSGEFYDSFELIIRRKAFIIDADATKTNKDGEIGTDLFEEWGFGIVGLTDESKTKLTKFLIPFLRAKILSKLRSNG